MYLAAHRDFLLGRIDVFDDPRWPMLTRFPELPPAFVASGGVVADGYLSAGVRVAGTVRRSVLGPSVMVEEGAVVEDSVLMTGVCVRAGARVQGVVADDVGVEETHERLKLCVGRQQNDVLVVLAEAAGHEIVLFRDRKLFA